MMANLNFTVNGSKTAAELRLAQNDARPADQILRIGKPQFFQDLIGPSRCAGLSQQAHAQAGLILFDEDGFEAQDQGAQIIGLLAALPDDLIL